MPQEDRPGRQRRLRRAVLAGDTDAWRALYEIGFGPLLGFVRRRCAGDEHRVEEVLQEVWMIAVRRLRRFDPDRGPFEAWVIGIARNVLRNVWRRDRQDDAAGPGAAESVPGPDPVAVLDQSEHIALAMATLPHHYRTILRAKYEEEMTVNEIAERTLQTAKSVESLLSRARAAFRRAYHDLD